jgi:hypothetical protein
MADNFSSSAVTSESIEGRREADRYVLNVPMNTWTAGLFRYRTVEEAAPQLISYQQAGSNATVTVKNHGDAPIKNAVYISRDGISDVFDLAAGEEEEISLSSPPASKFSDWYLGKLGQGSNEATVFTDLAAVLDREIGGQQVFRVGFFDSAQMTNTCMHIERPVILGFVEKSPSAVSFKRSLKRRSMSFYVVHL